MQFPKLKFFTLTLFLFTFFGASKVVSQCPNIQVIELLDVPGFAQTDELVVCGRPDTLSLLLFIEEAGQISGTQMTLDFEPGMQYAGFELTHYDATTSISVVNPCLLYTSPSPRDATLSRMPSSA